MKHCIHCGNTVKQDATFCTECGEVIEADQHTEQANASETGNQIPAANSHEENDDASQQQRVQSREPSPHKKRTKITSMIVIILALLCVSSYFFINKYIFSPEAVSNRFIEALNDNDASKVQNLINDSSQQWNVSKDEVQVFLDYVDDHPKVLPGISSHLNQVVENPEQLINAANFTNNPDEEALVTIQQNGKKWLLFDRYVISILPMYLEVEMSEESKDDIKLFVNNQEVGSKGKQTTNLGPLLPGTHHVKATLDSKYGNIEDTKEVVFSETGPDAVIEFDFQTDYYVSVYSDNHDATIYVNKESSKQTIEDVQESRMGPFPRDGSIELYAEKDFSNGTKKSDVVKIDEDTHDVDLSLGYDDYDEAYGTVMNDEDEDNNHEEDIEDVILSHYEGISNQVYETAYGYFSASKKDEYSLETWSKDLKNTIEDDVVSLEVDDIGEDEAEASIKMISYEKDGDDVVVREWEGYWILVIENNQWKLDKAKLEQTDTYTE